ncbi:MAG: hypothetical protein ACE5GK_01900 [Nitrospiria bacterium]
MSTLSMEGEGMRIAAMLFAILTMPIYPSPLQAGEHPSTIPAGTIVPKHERPEVFEEMPNPILIRVINRGNKKVYLHGFKRGASKKVHFFFYHKEPGSGWRPFFETLPCDHPTCQNLHAIRKPCGASLPYIVELASAGRLNSLKEFRWDGLLYQQVEAHEKARKRKYCYRGIIPRKGQIRIEMEYSHSFQNAPERKQRIGRRQHAAIEFSLPAGRPVYDIVIGG